MKTCNCLIGIVNSYELNGFDSLYVDDYIYKINEVVNTGNHVNKVLYKNEILKIKKKNTEEIF